MTFGITIGVWENMPKMNEKLLRKNVRLYGWFKIFNKRVFFPTTAIYLVDVGHVSLAGIGVITVVTAVVSLIAQMPTGYVADRYTRRLAMILGSVILALGAAVLAVWPSLLGGLLAGVLVGLGFAFISGASQALIHDSLEACGKTDQFIKIMGRAQSMGLLGNIVLIGLVPMTYTIDKRLPFALGIVAFVILLGIAWAFAEPQREQKPSGNRHAQEIVTAMRTFVNRRTVVLFIAIGLVFGLYAAPMDYSNLVLKDLGLAPQYIGWVFSISSFVAAIGGYGLHHLQRFSFKTFMFLDILICCGFFVAIGLTHNLTVAIVAFLINVGFWRLRGILYQHYLLAIFKGTNHKATLISLIGFGEGVFVVLLPLLFAFAITHGGYYKGYAAIGVVMTLLLSGMTVVGMRTLHRARG